MPIPISIMSVIKTLWGSIFIPSVLQKMCKHFTWITVHIKLNYGIS